MQLCSKRRSSRKVRRVARGRHSQIILKRNLMRREFPKISIRLRRLRRDQGTLSRYRAMSADLIGAQRKRKSLKL